MFTIYYMMIGFLIFFFKQKTAYEMRISDWSSDVCSSDLPHGRLRLLQRNAVRCARCRHGARHPSDLCEGRSVTRTFALWRSPWSTGGRPRSGQFGARGAARRFSAAQLRACRRGMRLIDLGTEMTGTGLGLTPRLFTLVAAY